MTEKEKQNLEVATPEENINFDMDDIVDVSSSEEEREPEEKTESENRSDMPTADDGVQADTSLSSMETEHNAYAAVPAQSKKATTESPEEKTMQENKEADGQSKPEASHNGRQNNVNYFEQSVEEMVKGKDQQTLEYQAWEAVKADRRNHTVLRSTIDSYHVDPDKMELQIMTHYKSFPVIIAADDFFMPDMKFTPDYYETSLTNYEKVQLKKMLKDEKRKYISANEAEYELYVKEHGEGNTFFSENWISSKTTQLHNHLLEIRKLKIKSRTVRYMLGAKICFCIKSCKLVRPEQDKENTDDAQILHSIHGNRVTAMQLIQHIMFVKKKNPVSVGDIVTANVLRVTSTTVHAECCGVETRIPTTDLSNRQVITDASDAFKPGDSFKVYVRKIFPPADKKATYGFSIAVSRRLYERNMASKELLYMHVGDVHMGQVSYVSKDRSRYNVLLNNGVSCSVPARFVSARLPLYIQDRVIVEIIKIDTERSRVVGKAEKLF